jgi:hypothetical protein
MLIKHREVLPRGSTRACDKHGGHGFLYVCPEYSESQQNEIRQLGEEFRRQCREGTIKIVVNGVTING